jgi:Vitamin K-dependent gamma-carboxylase
VIERIRRWRDEIGAADALVVARVAVGLLLLQVTARAWLELKVGYFGDVFHWPMIPEALVVPASGYEALLVAQALLAVLVVAGLRARAALFASAVLGMYVLFCDRLQFHNNRLALATYALLLAFTPCERRWGSREEGPLWAARLAQVQVAIVYLASGGSKLIDPDWRDGRVILTRFLLYGENAVRNGVPRSVVDALSTPTVASLLAAVAIATEVSLAVAVWPRRTRAFALWWGVGFHLTIEATSRVEGFTWLTLAMYALFATPDVRARRFVYDEAKPWQRRAARVVRALDWLARFHFESATAGSGDQGIVVVQRDGTRARGIRAVPAVARAIPLLFPLWIPLEAIARIA